MRLTTYSFATRLIATIGAITLAMASYSATFTGSGVGAIPDGTSGTCPAPGLPLNITFAATGLTSTAL
ncbi:MAG TPA: hypothetical protein PKN64_02055, partial [Casimicrobium sp.]|nr:hypothetical protein [Casimicrobium sp.]